MLVFMQVFLTPGLILQAYSQGLFPMADRASDTEVHWVCPEKRGQLSIGGMHVSRSLKRLVRRFPFEIRVDHDFAGVMKACAAETADRSETWINGPIYDVFCELHEMGYAHSVECWRGDELVGGLYGLAIGQVFCGESMFSRESNASKIALVHLAARLHAGGFQILDTQFVNDHLTQFGVYEVSHEDYCAALVPALQSSADFTLAGRGEQWLASAYLDHLVAAQ